MNKNKIDDYVLMEDKYYKENEYERKNRNRITPIITSNIKNKKLLDVNKFPKENEIKYKEIENFNDFDYINSIAYEMLIRTKEFKNIETSKLTFEEKIKELLRLGLDYKEYLNYEKKKSSRFNLRDSNNIIFALDYDLRLSDIDNGIEKLIHYYLTKNHIFTITNKNDKNIFSPNEYKYESCINISYEKVLLSSESYYIPAKYDYENSYNEQMFCRLNKDIPLQVFETDFLKVLKDDIPSNVKGKVYTKYTRPLLKFKECSVVDFQINLNLSKKNILNIVSKLKDDFDNKNIEVYGELKGVYNKNHSTNDLKRHLPFKFSKKSIAKAFFVYDLYKKIAFSCLLKQEEIKEISSKKIKEIEAIYIKKIKERRKEKTAALDASKKSMEIKELNKEYKRYEVKLKNKMSEEIKEEKRICKHECTYYQDKTILEELLSPDISSYTIKKYLQFMCQYIDNTKYKELIVS